MPADAGGNGTAAPHLPQAGTSHTALAAAENVQQGMGAR